MTLPLSSRDLARIRQGYHPDPSRSFSLAAEAYTDDLKLLTFRSVPGHVKVMEQAIGAESAVADGYSLGASFPNPFSESTEVSFRIPETTDVQFAIFDVNGQEVRRFIDRYQSGEHKLEWDGNDQEGRKVSAGVYYLRMIAPDFTATRKMVFIRE